MTDSITTISDRMKRYSVAEIQRATGLPYSTVSCVKRGLVAHPRIDTYRAIERGLDLLDAQGSRNADKKQTKSRKSQAVQS